MDEEMLQGLARLLEEEQKKLRSAQAFLASGQLSQAPDVDTARRSVAFNISGCEWHLQRIEDALAKRCPMKPAGTEAEHFLLSLRDAQFKPERDGDHGQ